MKKPEEHQIFFDPSGRRWRWARISLALLLIVSGVFLFQMVPRTLGNPTPPQLESDTVYSLSPQPVTPPSLDVLADKLSHRNLPVIGQGPLVRVIQLISQDNAQYGIDPFSHATALQLSADEALATADHDYAIQRYGQTASKRIALTFDDGPDPLYSGQILDALSKHGIPATFFVLGENVVKHQELAQRMVREGHVIANHTFSHVNLSHVNAAQLHLELSQTQRAIRAVTHHDSAFFRIPYGGDNDQDMRNFIRGILAAQKLGYIVTSFNFDTNDWDANHTGELPMPAMTSGDDTIVLLHDAGGDRSRTVAYIERIAAEAQENGYTFANFNQLYPQLPMLFTATTPATEDRISLVAASAVLAWPQNIIQLLFFITLFSILLSLFINTLLSLLHMRKSRFKRRPNRYEPLVSILVPAYNESTVIIKTVTSLLKSSYKHLEIIIIDDGSKDDTWDVATKLSSKSKRVHSLTQSNGGKAAALNHGIRHARGEIIICVDADTVFPPQTVSRLVRHFVDPTIGAVAGSVKVGNVRNLLARWQALEYTVSIHLERTAHAYLGAIMIVPGACGAWRKTAILAAGGYSSSTLAEDCDLTLAIHEAGYRVIQDNSAVGYTEVPLKVGVLAKQRFRWIFGNIQSFWKHRRIVLDSRYGWLGAFVMPHALFNIIMPIIFIPTLIMLAIENIANGHLLVMLFYAALTLSLQFIASVIGVLLARERLILLTAAPLTRLIYSPLKTYLLYKSLLTIVKGAHVGWGKIKRTGTVSYIPAVKLASVRPIIKH